MSTKKKEPKKKGAKRKLEERRFEPGSGRSHPLSVAGGFAGALALGAGVYGQWIRQPGYPWATYLVAGGAIVFGAALWFGDVAADPLRVGAAGVAVEKGKELERLAWCDMQSIRVEHGLLVLTGKDAKLTVPIAAHRTAAAWILKEAVTRVPEALDVKGKDQEGLPTPKDDDGELVAMEQLQIAGRHCAASAEPIAMEKDARLCPTCAAVYHREHVPKICVTCGDTIAGRAYAV